MEVLCDLGRNDLFVYRNCCEFSKKSPELREKIETACHRHKFTIVIYELLLIITIISEMFYDKFYFRNNALN